MRVLLTGIPGWLGNRFLEILAQGYDEEGPLNDWQIRCLSLDSTDSSLVDAVSQTKPVEKVAGDVAKIETLRDAVRGVDTVFHIAGIVHPRRTKQFFEINATGTHNMLTASVQEGVGKFIYISSSSAAGTNRSRSKLLTENDAPEPLAQGIGVLLGGRFRHGGFRTQLFVMQTRVQTRVGVIREPAAVPRCARASFHRQGNRERGGVAGLYI